MEELILNEFVISFQKFLKKCMKRRKEKGKLFTLFITGFLVVVAPPFKIMIRLK